MTKHKPQNQLVDELAEANQRVPVDSLWTHYKNPGLHYKIVGHAILEATDQAAVLYQAQYGDKITFVRPFENFVEILTIDSRETPRFFQVEA